MKTYHGLYKPTEKYCGDPEKVVYRSLWELATFRWLDDNPNIVKWSSEETPIRYRDASSGKVRTYYPDVHIWFKNKKVILVEIKPKKELNPPKVPKRRTRRYINEVKTFATNQSKWKYAREWCLDRNIKFEIWTEDILKSLGICILTS